MGNSEKLKETISVSQDRVASSEPGNPFKVHGTDVGRRLGLETELMLIDDRGGVCNRAAEIVGHCNNTGNIVPEFSQAVVETNPPPSAILREIDANLRVELKTVQTIAESMGLTEVPLSEIGPDNTSRQNGDSRRYALFDEIMGAKHCDMERSLCGTHLHLDHKCDLVGQYNLLQSMDPVFVLMSSSSFVRGRNSVNCGRVNCFRNAMFCGFPHLNQLLDYVSVEEDLVILEKARSEFFLNKLESTEENKRIFGGYNNGSSPLRKTDHTIEIRCADSNMPTLAVAMAAFYKGVLERVFELGSLEIIISPLDSAWRITDSEIVLPSYSTLKLMESEGILLGTGSMMVCRYLTHLLAIAEEGLPSDEVRYLQPFKEILQHKRNVADLVRDQARLVDPSARETISLRSAALVSLLFGRLYRDDVDGGSQLMDMIRNGVV
jgi:hypothetical protein